MTPAELKDFFSTYGGSGKPIGDEHEKNVGIGAKTSLMPWNRHGMVVLSWVDGEGYMIHGRYNKSIDDYELREFKIEYDDGTSELDAVTPLDFDCELDLDWTTVKPPWINDHGTMIVLFGNRSEQDTILGDPRFDSDKGEQTVHGLGTSCKTCGITNKGGLRARFYF